MKFKLKLGIVCGCVTLSLGAAMGAPSWQEGMQSLSSALTDVFPFLYSRHEFRDKKNKTALLKNFDRFTSVTHDLPESAGKGFIGSQPLFSEIKTSIKNDFTEAKELLNTSKYDLAQTTAQRAVQKCFACHTAIQVGPIYPATNQEVMSLATPFTRGKMVAFGAIRQFSGTLDLIEKEVLKPKAKISKIELAKLHMVVSLRALQDFSRAEKFLTSVQKNLKGDKDLGGVFEQWAKDIQRWKTEPQKIQEPNLEPSDSNFVAQLQESFKLHNQVSQASAEERAQTLYKLGKIYQSLGLVEFSELPKIYYTACLKEEASKSVLDLCQKSLSAK